MQHFCRCACGMLLSRIQEDFGFKIASNTAHAVDVEVFVHLLCCCITRLHEHTSVETLNLRYHISHARGMRPPKLAPLGAVC